MQHDDEYNAIVQTHPRDLPRVVQDFVEHPHVRAAVQRDMNEIQKRGPNAGGTNLGPQFG